MAYRDEHSVSSVLSSKDGPLPSSIGVSAPKSSSALERLQQEHEERLKRLALERKLLEDRRAMIQNVSSVGDPDSESAPGSILENAGKGKGEKGRKMDVEALAEIVRRDNLASEAMLKALEAGKPLAVARAAGIEALRSGGGGGGKDGSGPSSLGVDPNIEHPMMSALLKPITKGSIYKDLRSKTILDSDPLKSEGVERVEQREQGIMGKREDDLSGDHANKSYRTDWEGFNSSLSPGVNISHPSTANSSVEVTTADSMSRTNRYRTDPANVAYPTPSRDAVDFTDPSRGRNRQRNGPHPNNANNAVGGNSKRNNRVIDDAMSQQLAAQHGRRMAALRYDIEAAEAEAQLAALKAKLRDLNGFSGEGVGGGGGGGRGEGRRGGRGDMDGRDNLRRNGEKINNRQRDSNGNFKARERERERKSKIGAQPWPPQPGDMFWPEDQGADGGLYDTNDVAGDDPYGRYSADDALHGEYGNDDDDRLQSVSGASALIEGGGERANPFPLPMPPAAKRADAAEEMYDYEYGMYDSDEYDTPYDDNPNGNRNNGNGANAKWDLNDPSNDPRNLQEDRFVMDDNGGDALVTHAAGLPPPPLPEHLEPRILSCGPFASAAAFRDASGRVLSNSTYRVKVLLYDGFQPVLRNPPFPSPFPSSYAMGRTSGARTTSGVDLVSGSTHRVRIGSAASDRTRRGERMRQGSRTVTEQDITAFFNSAKKRGGGRTGAGKERIQAEGLDVQAAAAAAGYSSTGEVVALRDLGALKSTHLLVFQVIISRDILQGLRGKEQCVAWACFPLKGGLAPPGDVYAVQRTGAVRLPLFQMPMALSQMAAGSAEGRRPFDGGAALIFSLIHRRGDPPKSIGASSDDNNTKDVDTDPDADEEFITPEDLINKDLADLMNLDDLLDDFLDDLEDDDNIHNNDLVNSEDPSKSESKSAEADAALAAEVEGLEDEASRAEAGAAIRAGLWRHVRHEMPVVDRYFPGDGFVVSVDGARMLPHSVTVTRALAAVYDSNGKRLSHVSAGVSLPDATLRFPAFSWHPMVLGLRSDVDKFPELIQTSELGVVSGGLGGGGVGGGGGGRGSKIDESYTNNFASQTSNNNNNNNN
eukprot:CAMPEP_0175070720 /NCGR_PEP_ID=MMETSP0052_2-20121109/18863_1 /TAXON_ID=51329 ORGANISM="Polytomella parva, Strain SAG 63-3" /NCGR_SAMPLE_ID=MMETSP0052_2 /ASSEMBLY_ACC=CAM_ASM_000194 /LENGTH=1099 /DNA_ID=CAMNT_0016337849 /DNA_START=98 /DNA_END=3394 /DNA_ORIENTATION=+